MFGEGFAGAILLILLCVVVFLLTRKLVLWYFKLDVLAQSQKDILEQLKIMNGIAPSEQKPSSFIDDLKKGMGRGIDGN